MLKLLEDEMLEMAWAREELYVPIVENSVSVMNLVINCLGVLVFSIVALKFTKDSVLFCSVGSFECGSEVCNAVGIVGPCIAIETREGELRKLGVSPEYVGYLVAMMGVEL